MGNAISNRNFYGYAAENIVRADLAKKEIVSLSPDIPWTHYDMVADIGGSFVKIQVKTKMSHDGYRMIIDNRKSNGTSRPYTESDYDVLAIVDLENRRVAYLPYEVWQGRSQISIMLREVVDTNGYGRGKQPLYFSDYTNFPEVTTKEIAG
ncbi:group I intron-associated PD-(D/E)XK endonuclease [Bacillus velezensis]|uniref:group I intron-associated PD-(D/E)XK endonuclease n=1 Tax=Bacillus velezensis TaxID=492670 RepID=UPI002DC05F38|nr:group I intron-associated PD-(D/E)XK endonuclease [Bacillus velezensis]MEC3797999.1 group I intron-associated PD-(D/E)XK endonuclease [Bacillus velezensis]